MSRIDELIAEHCPDGVEHRPLSAVGTLFSGLTGKSKADFVDGNARFVSYVNVFNNIETNVAPNDFVQVGLGERQNRVRYGDVLFTASSESAAEVGMASGVTLEPPEPLYLNSFCFGFRPTDPEHLDPSFAKHLFRAEGLRRQIIRTANGVTRINISKDRFRDIKIPLLPVAIQREVAGILDKMESLKAELESELESELEYRSRQYAFYRDQLLSFDGDDRVRWVPMSEVLDMRAGRHLPSSSISAQPTRANHVRVFGGNGHRGFGESVSHTGPHLLVGRQGALCGNVHRVDGDFYATEHAVVARASRDLDTSFAFHLLDRMNLNQYKSAGAQPGLAVRVLAALTVPVPTLNEQQRIASILDKFDALVNDLSSGLPAEIAARQKQYEHYRDKLLTFKEAV